LPDFGTGGAGQMNKRTKIQQPVTKVTPDRKAKAAAAAYSVIEPRVMLDANLGWTIDASDSLTDALQGVSDLLDDFAAFDTFVDGFETTLDAIAPIVDDGDSVLDALSKTVAALRESADALKAGADSILDDLVTDTFQSDLRSSFANWINSSAPNLTAGERAAVAAQITLSLVETAFGKDDFLAGSIDANLNALVEGLTVPLTGAQLTAFQTAAKADLGNRIETALGGDVDTTLEFALTNRTVLGNDLTFTAGATAGEVDVAIDLPDLELDLSALFAGALQDATLPVDLSLLGAAGGIGFTLQTTTSATAVGINATDFDLDNLLTFGGDLTVPGSSLSLGLLEMSIDGVETAEFALGINTAAGMTLGSSVNLSTLAVTTTATDATLTGSLQVNEAGGPDTFVEVVAGAEYDLIAVDLSGTTAFVAGLNAAAADKAFGAALTVSGVLKSATASTTTDRITAFLASIDTGFDVDLSASVPDAATRAGMELALESLAQLGTEEIFRFLADIGAATQTILNDAAMDVTVPFTDISLSIMAKAIADVFASLPQSFLIDPAQLGFSTGAPGTDLPTLAPLQSTISAALNVQLAQVLPTAAVDTLKTLSSLDLRVVTGEVDSEGKAVVTAVTVDLTTDPANAVLTDPDATDADVLAAIATALDTALAALNFDVVIQNGAFRITSAFPDGNSANAPLTFGIIGGGVRGVGFDDSVSLRTLGFGLNALDLPKDYELVPGDTDETVLTFFGAASQTLIFGPQFADEMIGVAELMFNVSVGGEDHSILIKRPVDGWVLAGNVPNYDDIAAAFNTAFTDAGFALTATVLAGDAGLSFGVPPGTDEAYVFGIDPNKMMRALSIDGLFDWVNVELNKIEVLEGSKLMLSEEGELLFQFPDITRSATIASTSQLSGLQVDQLGLGELENVELSANLEATLTGTLNMVAGIDLVAVATGLLAPGPVDMAQLMSDSTFLDDVDLVVDLTGKATEVTGSAQMGLFGIDIGATDASLNYLAVNAQLYVGIVGEDTNGEKTTRASITNIREAFEESRVDDLIGRYELQGGILTEEGANAYDTAGDRATIDTLQILTAHDAVVGPDEELVMLFATLGDIRINAGEMTGLNEGLIDGINIAIGDGLDPLNTFSVAVYSNDAASQEAIDSLSNLEDGDILDTLSAIGHTLQLVGEKLKTDLPFLDQDIPLFNFSLLDGVDFATEFVDTLREVRDNPQATLDKIEEFLESIFGADTIELEWVAAEQTITIAMEFGFLKDYQEELAFSLDLDELLAGNFAGAGIAADVAELISGIADVSGDGTLVFDPDLTLRMKFGIDLRPTLNPPTDLATPDLTLQQLVSGSIVTTNASGTDDIQITWKDLRNPGAPVEKIFGVDLEGLTTLSEIVDAINAALADGIGAPASDTVSFTYDEATGTISFVDTEGFKIDTTGVEALFGAVEETSAGDPRVIAFDPAFTAFAAAHSFDLVLGADGDGFPVTVALAADAARDTIEEFAAAVNAALTALSVSRDVLTSIAGPVLEIRVSQLIKAEVVAGALQLIETNFAETLVYEARDFAVRGVDASEAVFLAIQSLGESNIASVLGFGDVEGVAFKGQITSEALYEYSAVAAPRVYLDTAESAVFAEIKAGIENSLNITIGIGPLEVNVVDGSALLTNGKSSTDPALFGFSFIDVDGDAFDEQYDLRDLFDLVNDPDRTVLDMIQMDVQVGIFVDLPLSDSLGIFNPATDGIGYSADLLLSIDNQPLSSFDIDQIETHFEGDLIALYNGEAVDPDNLEVRLPDLAELFANFNYLAFLNDPRAVLAALDTILNQMQSLFDNYLSDIDLPVIGDKIGAGVTFFDDFRYKVLEEIKIKAETPDPVTGKLPTTVDLLTNEVNALMNDLFDTTGVTYMQAYLDTSGSASESYLIATLNFNGVIFDEDLAVDFEFGIPGLDMEVTEGSKLRMTLDYLVNIGFGIDSKGFFLLNDTDDKEIGITFTVDAGTFEGSAKVLGVLGLEAKAVTLDADGNVTSTTDGVAVVSATLGADLFSDQGLEIIDSGTAGDGEVVRNFGDIALEDALGNELTFEKLIYFNQIDYGNLITFEFGAEFELQVSLSGSVLDPTTGEPIRIGGVAILPTVATEFWVKGSYAYGDGLNIEKLSFENVRLNMQELYEAVLKPVLDPIMDVVNPLADYFRWTQETPFKEALSVAGSAFPIIGIANTVITIGLQVTDMVNSFAATGGMLIFGDYDFSANADGITSGEKTVAQSSSSVTLKKNSSFANAGGAAGNPFGVFGNLQSGIAIEIPLLSDPSNILDLIMGKFDQVDLVEVHMNLFNFDTGKIDLVDEILSGVGLPGWARSAIKSAFQAEMSLKFKAGFSAGYDLSGIVNFVNTLDAVRLLDGVYIDSAPGSLVNVDIWGRFALNLFIAGAEGEVGAGVQISFNDPNSDGKLRIPELIALVEAAADALAAGDVGEALGLIFVGEAYYKAKLSVWAGINLPWPLPDLKWSTTVFDIGDTISFGGNPVPARMVTDLDAGETAFLNIGARAGDSMTKIIGDGNDRLVLTGGGSGSYSAAYSQGSKSFNGTFANIGSSIVMQAGEGNNVIDLSGASGALPTVTYTGGGTDTIVLPATGLHVVFAGNGNDTIRTNDGSSGTYIIFGEEGSDTIDIRGGNVIYIGDDSFGARERFQQMLATSGATEASIRSFFGIDANGVPQAGATQANFVVGGVAKNLHALMAGFTIDTQLAAGSDADKVTLGGGNHVVLTGSGADDIKVNGTAGIGTMIILSGAGSDRVEVTNALAVTVEAGAGGDRVYVNASSSTIWGYGAAGGQDGLLGTEAATGTDALAIRDSMDILIGGDGADRIIGQLGGDYIEGGNGADTLVGGIGDDIVVGGKMVLTDKDGAAIILRNLMPNAPLQNGLTISVENLADGNDDITGSAGLDILLGGGGNDTMRGNAGSDVLLGDFGKVGLSSNLVAQEVFTQFDTSSFNGTDVLDGGLGGDVLIAGGGITGQTESITDLFGSNVVLGDFGKAAGARMLDAVSLVESFASTNGSSDSITTGRGNDIQIGGEGNDTLNAGSGGDIVIGDLGRVNPGNSIIESMTSTDSGDDTITTDATDNVFDIVIGGGGSDTITGGLGGMVFLGDDGKLTLDGVALSMLLAYEAPSETATPEELAADEVTRARIAAIAKLVEGQVDASAGDDSVTIDGGILVALLGGGDDFASNSDAADFVYVLGDNGKITIETTGTKVESDSDATDGNDTITLGSGNDWIVAGSGDDSVDAGDGENFVLGDSGSFDGTDLISVRTVRDGSDTLVAGSGNDWMIAGGDADSVISGDGNDVILGDSGTYDGVTLTSALNEGDGNDTVSAGGGNDWLILGQGDDDANLGEGINRVLGDSGQVTAGLITSTQNDDGGSDTITGGTGTDEIIAGAGADSIAGGDGENRILGDSGSYDGVTLTSALNAGDGNDTLTSGSGNDWVILGQGDDDANLGAGLNRVLGDSGQITAGLITSTQNGDGGSDTITSGAGNDEILAGAGADSILGGDGNNRILGDSGSYDGAELISALNAGDGNDTVTAGNGNDWAILGQGDDTANLGTGNNRVLADSGRITATLVTSTENAEGGNDSITTGSGNDVILAGAGADTVAGGDGNNVVLGDAGSLEETVWTLTSALTDGDGNDLVTTGTGNDRVILGQGDDDANLGAGNNRAIGDSGVIVDTAALTLDTTSILEGGNDTIRSAGGDDILIGGANSDLVEAGNGDNTVLGDSGNVTYDPAVTAGMTSVTTVISTAGAADTLTTGDGRDVILGGEGGDSITAGAGADLVLGDQGVVTGSSATRFGTLTSLVNEVPGDDVIDLGAGNDVAMGGLGNDSVYAGQGEDMVLGDSGLIRFSGLSAIEEIVLQDQDRGGDDFITAAGVGGDNILVGQFGADTVEGGTDDDVILGDFALFTFLPGAAGFVGQSSADRMQVMTSIRVDLSFNDVLQGDLGSDFMLGGMGDDLLYGDAGQDFMIGDMIIFTRTWAAGPFGSIFEETTVDTNFAFVTGGYDQFFSGEGPDVMIGGLGPDLFFGNTEFDLIYSDAYAGLFYATWADGFTGDTPQRFLIKSNFAGPGAIDVVSESQQNSSIGSPLDLRNLGFNANSGAGEADAMDRLAGLLAGSTIPHMASMVIDILGSYDIVKAISALVAAGIDPDVLVDALLNEVMQQLLAMDAQNLIVAEIMIERMIRLYLAQAGLLPAADADTDDDQANASDDGARLWKIAAE
jgi:Ca2+-binding RTX toxin-like protein